MYRIFKGKVYNGFSATEPPILYSWTRLWPVVRKGFEREDKNKIEISNSGKINKFVYLSELVIFTITTKLNQLNLNLCYIILN